MTAIKTIVDRELRSKQSEKNIVAVYMRLVKPPRRAIDSHTLREALNAPATLGHNNRVDVPRVLIPWRSGGWLPGRKEGELESDVAHR